MTAAPQDDLPPLPASDYMGNPPTYTQETLRSYARAARAPLLAEIERLKALVTERITAELETLERAHKAEAELAAAEALLKEAQGHHALQVQSDTLLRRIDAFLGEPK